jgi:hypothetical protein
MYEIVTTVFNDKVVLRTNADGSVTSFFANEDNPDYQQYLKWLAEQQTPAEEQP